MREGQMRVFEGFEIFMELKKQNKFFIFNFLNQNFFFKMHKNLKI
jgi:hypothetical protein